GCPRAMPRTQSAPARVLPAPRPPSMSQTVHGSRARASPGSLCSGRQRSGQWRSAVSNSASDQEAVAALSLLLRHNPLKVASKLVAEFVNGAGGSFGSLGVIEPRAFLFQKRLRRREGLGEGCQGARGLAGVSLARVLLR